MSMDTHYEELADKINDREFCLVTAVLKDSKYVYWIIFRRDIKVARKIATDFLKKNYGDKLDKVWIYPRKYLRDARVCVELGRIIPLE